MSTMVGLPLVDEDGELVVAYILGLVLGIGCQCVGLPGNLQVFFTQNLLVPCSAQTNKIHPGYHQASLSETVEM